MKPKRVVMFSGGIGSWMTAKLVVEKFGSSDVTLLFADTKMEDADLYRFLDETRKQLKCKFVRIAHGASPWELFFKNRFLGNSRIDLCSRILKREPTDKWLKNNCDPTNTICYIGIDWTEINRFSALRVRKLPWVFEAPLTESPFYSRAQIFERLKETGIRPPRLYGLGFQHNNCGGFCVKAGKAHFINLLEKLPDVFKEQEEKEQKFRNDINPNVSILRSRKGGRVTPLPLSKLRKEHEKQRTLYADFGGCGCFLD